MMSILWPILGGLLFIAPSLCIALPIIWAMKEADDIRDGKLKIDYTTNPPTKTRIKK